jgi:hypothetical protein
LSPVTDDFLSGGELSESSDGARFTDQPNSTEEDKVDGLRMIFANFKDHTLRLALKRTGGDMEKAFDELLNRQYLYESGHLAKGVDGFFMEDEEEGHVPGRKKRGSRKPLGGDEFLGDDKADGLGVKAHDSKPGRTKLHVDYSVVLPSIIRDELENADGVKTVMEKAGQRAQRPSIAASLQDSKPSRAQQARQDPPRREMGLDQASVSQAPNPSTSKADPSGWVVVATKQRTVKQDVQIPGLATQAGPSHMDMAAAMYRKGTSNPLYRQAATIYAERAWNERRAAGESISIMSDQLVDSQSTARKVDLHGVTVLDGVRIAKSRVWAWWDGLSESEREHRAANTGITVITGLGRHSSGGVSRLRQAVGAALRNDGWKMDVLTGSFVVTGRHQ